MQVWRAQVEASQRKCLCHLQRPLFSPWLSLERLLPRIIPILKTASNCLDVLFLSSAHLQWFSYLRPISSLLIHPKLQVTVSLKLFNTTFLTLPLLPENHNTGSCHNCPLAIPTSDVTASPMSHMPTPLQSSVLTHSGGWHLRRLCEVRRDEDS